MQVGERQPEIRIARPADAGRRPGDARCREAEGQQRQERAADEPRREHFLLRGEDRERSESGAGEQPSRQIDPARAARSGGNDVAEQRPGGNFPGAAERPERERQCRQQAEGGCDGEAAGIDPDTGRDRQHIRQRRRRDQGGHGADDQAEHDAERGEHQDLEQVGLEHQGPGAPKAFQRRDGGDLAVEIAAHGVADADAADQQGRQAHQRQEQRQATDEAFDLRGGVGEVAHPPAGIGEAGLKVVLPRLKVGTRIEADLVVPGDHAAGLDQPGAFHRLEVDQQARPQDEAAGRGAVGFALDGAPDAEGRIADLDGIADIEVESLADGLFDHGAPDAVPLPDRIAQVAALAQRESAIERVRVIDRLQLHQGGAGAVLAPGHGARLHPDGDAALAFKIGPLSLADGVVEDAERHVAAQDRPPVGPQALR